MSDPGQLGLTPALLQLMADDLQSCVGTHVRSQVADYRLKEAAREAEVVARQARAARRTAEEQEKAKSDFKVQKKLERRQKAKERAQKAKGEPTPAPAPSQPTPEATAVVFPSPQPLSQSPAELAGLFPPSEQLSQQQGSVPPDHGPPPFQEPTSTEATSSTPSPHRDPEQAAPESEGDVTYEGTRVPAGRGAPAAQHPKPAPKEVAAGFKRPRLAASRDLERLTRPRKED